MVHRPLSTGYGGKIYPVNPQKEEILGLHSYRSILDIPDDVDLAVIVLPADKVPVALQQSIDKGVKGAIIITAGFAETGYEGKLLQDEVVKIARKGGIRFIGPNCMGISSASSHFNLCFMHAPQPGGIAFVSQSGTYGAHLSEKANAKGYGLSKFVSIGNQADITVSEYLDYLARDSETKVITFYIEGFKDGRRFFQLAREVVKKKPIVIYKGGKTGVGARAVQSHTGSLAGSHEVFEAMCRQAGIIRAQEAMHSFEMAEALVHQPLSGGKRIAIMGSGGQCVVTSDACAALGLEVPEFDAETVRDLQELLPPHAPPARNPVDFAGSARSIMEEARMVEKFLSLDYIDGVITNIPVNWTAWEASKISAPSTSHASHSSTEAREAAYFGSLPKKYHKPVVAVRWSHTFSEAVENILRKAGVPIFENSEQCARAMYALAKHAENRKRLKE